MNATLCAQTTAAQPANSMSAPSAVSSTVASGDMGRGKEFARNPWSFEPNQGQDKSGGERSNADYIAYGHGYLLRLEPAGASLQFQTCSEPKRACNANHSTLGLTFVGANKDAAIAGSGELPSKHSYLPTGDPRSWTTAVSTYARVNYQGIYPGVDLSFYGKAGQLEYDFILGPDRDPGKIQLALEGADHVRLDKDGDVSITISGSVFRLLKPSAYQLAGEGVRREPVRVSYKFHKADASAGVPATLTFSLGAYDRQRPLVIDPVLIYGTYIPGTAGYPYPPYYFADTDVRAMTADSKGNTYLAASVGGSKSSYSILKYDSNGNLLLNVSVGTINVSTSPQSIAVDSSGNIFVAGSTSVGIPVTSNAFQNTPPSGASQSGFLTVVKADGSSLLYSSYFGGSGGASILGMAIGPKGKAFVTGSGSGTFPTTSGAYQASSGNYNTSGFAAEFDPSLSGSASLIWSTMLTGDAGSQAQSTGTAIAVDSKGDAYVASSASADFPVTSGAYAYSGIDTNGAYVTELNPTGTAPIYSAFLGPGSPTGIAVDGTGAAYVTGSVGAADFPVTAGAYQTTSPSGFAAKLSSDGSQLVYSTFLGSPETTAVQGVLPISIALLPGCVSGCNAYIAGLTTSADFPVVNPVQAEQFFPDATPASPYGGSQSGFLVNLAADGKSVAYSTYLGALGSGTQNYGATPAVDVDSSGNVYFASNIYGPDAPATLPSVDNPGYGFLAKIGPANAGALVAAPNEVTFLNTLTQSAILRNVGSAAVELQRPFVFSSSEFSETDTCPSVMPGGSACTLQLSFAPTATGPRAGSLTVSSNSTNSPATIALSVPTDQTNVSISGLALAFSDQVLNTTSNAQALTITNEGTQAEPVSVLTPSEPDYLVSSTCPAQLAGGASCTISIKFQPTQIGLRSAYLDIGLPGVYTQIGSYYVSGYYQVALTGTGVLSAPGTGALTLSESSLNFGSVVENTGPAWQSFTVFNSGDTPVTVNSITASTAANMGQSGDFSLVSSPGNYGPSICGAQSQTGAIAGYLTPFSLAPQTSCVIYVGFQPSIAGQETGSVSITDSAAGSPHTMALSGIGLYSSQPLVISPSTMSFPPQPVGDPSAPQTFYVSNNGENQVVIDRAVTTGDFNIVDDGSSNCEGATVGSCSLAIAFTPTATGARTGTLTFSDSQSGTPLVFNLSGTGIQATGTLIIGQSSLSFPAQAKGSTSASQQIVVTNPGNSPITINTVTASGDFAVVPAFSIGAPNAVCGGVLAPGTTCLIGVVFSPTQSSGSETGTLSIRSTAGTATVNLSGSAIAGAGAVQITPAAVNFGSVKVGTATTGPSNEVVIYVNNTGNTPVAFPNPPVITGTSPTPSADFSVNPYGIYCQGNNYIPTQSNPSPVPMPPGASCSLTIVFNPSMQTQENATLTLVDSAGTQTITLTGTGTAQAPVAFSQPTTLGFSLQPISSSSASNQTGEVGLYDNGTGPITIASVAVTAGSSDFSIENNGPQCAGVTVQSGFNCTVYIAFTPSVAGYRTGSVTFKDSGGNSYVTQLVGYAVAAVKGASLTPQAAVLPDQSVGTSGTVANFTLSNNGNLPFTVGTVTGANVSFSGSSPNADFVDTAYVCSGFSVNPGGSCPVSIVFAPQSLGAKTGTVTIPVTYADSSHATFTATVSGTGVAATASANLYPQAYFFSSPQVVSATSTSYQDQVNFVLTNTGTVPLTVGNISGQDLTGTAGSGGDFVYPTGYFSSCAGGTVYPGGNCNVNISFIPLSVGTKTGSISLPVTYASGGTATFTATFSGTAVAPTRILQVTPSSVNFNVEVVGTTDLNNESSIAFSNIGNSPVTFSSATTNNANFTIVSNNCTQSLYAPGSCSITVAFTPLATTSPGTVTGVLSVVDNATGSPHTVPLSGTAISVAQQLGLSQTSVSFGSYAVGTTSPQQVVYLVDLGSSSPTQYASPSRVQINSIKLGGANASDFVEADNCGGALGFTISGRSNCEIAVSFAPGASSLGVRTASVTITPAQGPPLVIQLIGNGAATTTGPTALQFIPLAPCRVEDTRKPTGQFGGPQMAAKTSREFDIPQSDCGVPPTAVAYSLNVTVVPNAGLGYLTLWPSGQAQPSVSTLNSYDGRVKANAAIVPAGTNGGVSVYVSDQTNVILDVNGYFVPAGTHSALEFYPVTPCRVADTRNATSPLGGPSLSGGTSRAFQVQSSNCGIPSTAKAYSLNVTAVPHNTLGYLTSWPTGQAQPLVSTLNSYTGGVTANAAIVPAGTSGDVSIFVSDTTDVILDVNGYFAPPGTGGLSLYPVTPCRVIDTRQLVPPFPGLLTVSVEGSPCAPPPTAAAFVLNATVVPTGGFPYLTLWPAGESQPLVSTLNAYDGTITSNMAIVPTNNGSIDAYSPGPGNLILDLSSYFAP